MKTFKQQAAQGDLLLRKVAEIPRGFKRVTAKSGKHILAHSETGHHHYMRSNKVSLFRNNENPMVCYLQVDGAFANLVHDRSFDKHETLKIPTGTYELRRQREHTPEGWRRIED